MTEALVLPATVVDGFTKPLKNLVSRLKDVKVTDGMKQVGKQMESLRKEAEGVGKAVTNGFGGLTTGLGLGALGAGAFTAAGALTAVGTAVRSFADNAVHMDKFSKSTGIAMGKLKELQQVAPSFGINPDIVESGLGSFAQNIDLMRYHQGNYGQMKASKGLGEYADQLANSKNDSDALELAFKMIAGQKNPLQKRNLTMMLGLPEDFAAFTSDGLAALNKRRAEAAKNVPSISDADVQNARNFQDAISHLSATFENLKNSVGGELAPQIIAAADAFKDFADAHVGDVKEFFHDVGDAINKVDWAGATKNFRDLFDDIKSIGTWASENYKDLNSRPGDHPDAAPSRDVAKDGQYYKQERPSWFPSWFPDPDVILKGSERDRELQKKAYEKAHPPQEHPEANGYGGMARPMAYHPGMQAAFAGASTARDSAAVAILAKGVELGMIAFTQSYLGGGAAGGMGGGDGFQTVSYGGGRATFGGGGTGGSFDIGRAGTAPIPTGSKAQRAKGIVDSLMAAGMSRENAITWAGATMGAESAYGGAQRGDFVNGRATAFGGAQWHMPRVRDILKNTGIDVRNADMTDQTKAMIWEMKKMGIWDRAVKAGSAQEVLRLAIKEYERPLDQGPRQFNNRAAIANALRKSLAKEAANAGLSGGAGSAKPPTGKVDIHVHSKDHPVTVKQSDSDLFQGLKIDRGKSVSL